MKQRIALANLIIVTVITAGTGMLVSRIASADDGEISDAPFNQLLSNGSDTAAVSIQRSSGKVEVHLVNNSKYAPPSVAFTLRDDTSSPVILDLQAITPSETSSPIYAGYIPAPSGGSLSQVNGSFVGIEITIPWPFGEPSVLHTSNSGQAQELPFFR